MCVHGQNPGEPVPLRASVSIVIPAHNEAAVIGRLLSGLLAEAEPDEFEVLVVANGCHDATETVAVWSVAVPVSLYTAVLGVLHRLGEPDLRSALPAFVTVAAVLLVAAVGLVIGLSIGVAVLLVGVVMALSVAEHVVASR